MKYLASLNYSIFAQDAKSARRQAIKMIQISEALPGVVSPVDVFNKMEETRSQDKEHFVVFFLNTQNDIVGQETVSIGTLNSSIIHPREVFRTAIAKNCASVIVSHNHPSGNLEPSAEDLNVTRRLQDSGKLLGIEVLDHIIVSKNGFRSFREANLL